MQTIAMRFLPDVKVPCDVCHGARFNAETELSKIEHDLNVIADADWVINLGPEGGTKGGVVVGESTPEGLVGNVLSHPGAALRPVLARG